MHIGLLQRYWDIILMMSPGERKILKKDKQGNQKEILEKIYGLDEDGNYLGDEAALAEHLLLLHS
ncbi:MAG: hypothetical protein ACOC2J_01165 [bacterium]